MELHELSPFPVSIDWEGQEITLKPFDLRAMTWAERFFSLEGQGGYDRMNETLKNKHGEPAQQNAVVEIVHYLSSDQFSKIPTFKNEWKKEVERTWKERLFSRPWQPLLKEKTVPSKEPRLVECGHISTVGILKEEIRKHKNSVEIFNGFVAALAEIFKTSNPAKEAPEPELTGGAIFEFFKAQEAEKDPQPKINWAQIYTKLFAAGGMSIDEFYSLTPRQVFAITEETNYLDGDKLSIDAKLHGMKFKAPRRKEKQLLN